MKIEKSSALVWEKMQNLIPVIIQDAQTLQVLMLGYMNQEALQQTINTSKVTFYSRSKQRLWVKGETSGNYLNLIKIIPDCDQDSLLILVKPAGVTCHTGASSCFHDPEYINTNFLLKLEQVIIERYSNGPNGSYTNELFNAGLQRIAQKVGEEAVETILAATTGDKTAIINETSDLLYHLLVLLCVCDIKFSEINAKLAARG